jgi:hypothetical protein
VNLLSVVGLVGADNRSSSWLVSSVIDISEFRCLSFSSSGATTSKRFWPRCLSLPVLYVLYNTSK